MASVPCGNDGEVLPFAPCLCSGRSTISRGSATVFSKLMPERYLLSRVPCRQVGQSNWIVKALCLLALRLCMWCSSSMPSPRAVKNILRIAQLDDIAGRDCSCFLCFCSVGFAGFVGSLPFGLWAVVMVSLSYVMRQRSSSLRFCLLT